MPIFQLIYVGRGGVPDEYKKKQVKWVREFILLRKLMATKKENVISIHNCGESPFM